MQMTTPNHSDITQYTFLRNIWSNHFKHNLSDSDNSQDRIDRINKIVAMMKEQISTKTKGQLHISENLREAILSESQSQGLNHLTENSTFRKLKERFESSQMANEQLMCGIQKLEQANQKIQSQNSKLETEKSKLNKKVKDLIRRVLELSTKNVELEDEIIFSDNYGLYGNSYPLDKAESDLSESVVILTQTSENLIQNNPSIKKLKRSLIQDYAENPTKTSISSKYELRQSKSSKQISFTSRSKARLPRTNSRKSICGSRVSDGNSDIGDSSCMDNSTSFVCYKIKKSETQIVHPQKESSFFSENNSKIKDNQVNITFPNVSLTELQDIPELNLSELRSKNLNCQQSFNLQKEGPQRHTKSSLKDLNSESPICSENPFQKSRIIMSSRPSIKKHADDLRFSRKSSGQKLKLVRNMTKRRGNGENQESSQESSRVLQLGFERSLKDPRVYKENQFYTKFQKLRN